MADAIIDLQENETDFTIGKQRHMAALEAAWEIAALCEALRKAVTPDDNSQNHLVVRGLSSRIEGLSNSIMAALYDDAQATSEIYLDVTREFLPEQEASHV